MINWKTTLAGVITASVNLLMLYACDLMQVICLTVEQKTTLIGSATTIGLFIIAICAKDNNVTGGTKQQ